MRISLAAVNNYGLKTSIPVSRVCQTVNGVKYYEPFYDLDENGNPVDLGYDNVPDDVSESAAKLVEIFNVSPSEFTETGIRIPVKGRAESFSFDERPYLRRIYNTHSKKVLLMAGRQVEKSTLLGNIVLSYSCLNNYYRTLYVTPSAEQSKVFSRDRIHDIIQVSPTVKAYTNTNLTNAVFHKKFINYSQVIIRAAYLNADRCRGIPADTICLDELQDFIVDNIPVIEECASHSNFKIFRYSGTPKSLDNTIEHYWNQFSNQCEWAVPCQRHGTPKDKSSWFWNILREANIGKEGVVCSKCKEPIDVHDPAAQWVAFNPQTKHNEDRVTFEGYRLPQLMVPWIAKCPKGWKSIIEKQETYPRQKFNNEVMGLSYDSGVRPITKAQLKKCCLPDIKLSDYEFLRSAVSREAVFAGVDWGTGEGSYTVLSLGTYLNSEKFTIFWTHRFTGEDLEPEIQLDKICQIITQFNVRIVGCDYGGGFDKNAHLVRQFGPNKVVKYQYAANMSRGKVVWNDSLLRFLVHRTEVMSDIFSAFLRQEIMLPAWEEFVDPYGNDILNIFSEKNEIINMIQYKHSPGKTDDTFHSILYCFLASMLVRPRPDIIAPRKDS